jgi:8-oxo-dGTP pyrophosphatase MutT (NUDIX family)
MTSPADAGLARRLTETERDQSFPNVRPKDAATLILIDRATKVPKVLLGRRHAGAKFMPDKFVFPGGRVEKSDRAAAIASPLDPAVEAHLMRRVQRPSAHKARALALAAIRETFEETGLLIGRHMETPPIPGGPDPFAETGIYPDLAALRFVARAITPPKRPRRFDTRFFAADAETIAHRVDGIIGPDAELVELVWLPITDAQHLDMPTITRVVLEELQARIAAGFAPELPVPFYRMLNRKFRREVL